MHTYLDFGGFTCNSLVTCLERNPELPKGRERKRVLTALDEE